MKNRARFKQILGVTLIAACNGRLAVTDGSGGTSGEGGDSSSAATGSSGDSGGTSGTGATGGGLHGGTTGTGGNTASAGSGDVGSDGGVGAGPGTAGSPGGGQAGDVSTAGSGPISGCQDEVTNFAETDIDCGGPVCAACASGSACKRHADCASKACRASICQAPTCSDGVRNGDETGVDCGGSCVLDGGPVGRCPVVVTPCDCASSAELSSLACGVSGEHGLRTTYLDATGSAAALRLCDDESCDAYYWSLEHGMELIAALDGVVGLSTDGTTVLVDRSSAGPHPQLDHLPFLWRRGAAPVDLTFGGVHALSDDGTLALGLDGNNFGRWTQATGVVLLGAGSIYYGEPMMTPDGTYVVAQGETANNLGGFPPVVEYVPWLVRWDSDGNEQRLGAPAGTQAQQVRAISADGAVIVSRVADRNGVLSLSRYDAASGHVSLAPLPASISDRSVRLNADGSLLLGTLARPGAKALPSAFRWTEADGVRELAGTTGPSSVLQDATPDGSVAVGFLPGTTPNAPFVWSDAGGVRLIRAVLEQAAVKLDGWELGAPLAVSRDGKVVLGEGTCGGVPAVYRVALPE